MSRSNHDPMSTSKKRVLVIDDDKSILRTTCLALEKNGFEADTAETGKEALEKLKNQQYDVLLVDLRLPDIDGTEVLSRTNLPNAVKIMFTGYPSFVSGIEAMDRGVDAYLPKPVRPEEIVMVIKAKLASKGKLS